MKRVLGVVLGFIILVVGCAALISETDNNAENTDKPATQEEQIKEEPAEEPEEEAQEPQESVVQEEEAPEAAIPEEDEVVPFEYEQALKSAQNYVDTLHFSRQGLKQQLTSEYGSGFTEEEAEYALDQVYK